MTSDDAGVTVFEETCSSCEFYYNSSSRIKKRQFTSLSELSKAISSSNKKYNCIVGVSGGVDSSYVLLKAVNMGLRPLAVHMDNGWNSELAQNNIKNLVEKLGVDLFTYVIDWDEYRELMNAFFRADVVDVELLYDNAMLAVNYQLAKQHKIRYILAGTNHATEGVPMPSDWNWFKYDALNIKHIVSRNSNTQIKSMPTIGVIKWLYYTYVLGIKWIDFLDYIDFSKKQALSELVEKMDYKPYPYKHYESVFTRFYQGYILPEKFGIDKRRVHLSADILAGEVTRIEAQNKLREIPYVSEKQLNLDMEYFLKKIKWNKVELESYISRPRKEHLNYRSEKYLYSFLLNIYKKLVH